jgi:hypothetical protein
VGELLRLDNEAWSKEAILAFFTSSRGIRPEYLDVFGVEIKDGVALFPYESYKKRRYFKGENTRNWRIPAGSEQKPFVPIGFKVNKTVIVTEGETDAMRLYQALDDANLLSEYSVVGRGGNAVKLDPKYFSGAERVIFVVDNDSYEASKSASKYIAENAREFPSDIQVLLGPIPKPFKDLCEFFLVKGDKGLQELLGKWEEVRNFEYLDLFDDKTYRPYPIVDGLIYGGDIHLWFGEPGAGKSYTALALSLALAGGEESFLGFPVCYPSDSDTGLRVLYFDEENPRDVIVSRVAECIDKARTKTKIRRNFRYVAHCGINLRAHFDKILMEVVSFRPSLVVFDSLARVHSEDENSASAMSNLMRDCVRPLTLGGKCGVLILHHANKRDTSSAYATMRGSGDLMASADTVEWITFEERSLKIETAKSRRGNYRTIRAVVSKRTGKNRLEVLSNVKELEDLVI